MDGVFSITNEVQNDSPSVNDLPEKCTPLSNVQRFPRQMLDKRQGTNPTFVPNFANALSVGNRTIMIHEGQIILDIKGTERDNMTIPHLLEMFEKASGTQMHNDRMLLA